MVEAQIELTMRGDSYRSGRISKLTAAAIGIRKGRVFVLPRKYYAEGARWFPVFDFPLGCVILQPRRRTPLHVQRVNMNNHLGTVGTLTSL